MEKRFDGSVILVLQSGAHSKFSQTYIPFFSPFKVDLNIC